MYEFDYSEKWRWALTPDIVAMLTAVHEYKVKLDFFVEGGGEILTVFSEAAKEQSAEASNKIDGITLSTERLKKIVSDKTHPRTTGEAQIAGYRDVLSIIHESYAYLPFKQNIILQLYQNLYKYGGVPQDKFKDGADGAIGGLCSAYEEALKDGQADALIIIPMAALDFLHISPFGEGDGLMHRLLMLLLLNKAGYVIGKYISLERLIEDSAESYRNAIAQSSQASADGYTPFVRYILGTVLAAYKEFFAQTEPLTRKGVSKPERIAEAIKNAQGAITKTQLLKQCPDVSEITVQRTLAYLTEKGEIIKLGGGRYTQYVWKGEEK